MKYLLLTICLSVLTFQAFSQKTKFITTKEGRFIEEFFVLKSDKKIKHGSYVKYKTVMENFQIVPQVLESGSFEQGEKNGFWQYFHNTTGTASRNCLKEQGHYVQGRKNGLWTSYFLDSIPPNTNFETYGKKWRTDSISVNIDSRLRLKTAGRYLNDKRIGEWTSLGYDGKLYQKYDFYKSNLITDLSIDDSLKYNTIRSALFIGGLPSLGELISNEFDFTKVVVTLNEDSTSAVVSILIDTNGSVSESTIFQSNASEAFEKEAIRVMELTDDTWIPALRDGEATNSRYKMEFTIIRKSKVDSPNGKSFTIRYRPILES